MVTPVSRIWRTEVQTETQYLDEAIPLQNPTPPPYSKIYFSHNISVNKVHIASSFLTTPRGNISKRKITDQAHILNKDMTFRGIPLYMAYVYPTYSNPSDFSPKKYHCFARGRG